uniref:Uncharacterized protein n=1 Tax=Anopheles stephensi TaxID=30069 RepID=A0A182Y1V5_ANOST
MKQHTLAHEKPFQSDLPKFSPISRSERTCQWPQKIVVAHHIVPLLAGSVCVMTGKMSKGCCNHQTGDYRRFVCKV